MQPDTTPSPPGIILAAHGSRLPEAREALSAFTDMVADRHPDCVVRLARTMGDMHHGRHLRPLLGVRSVDAVFLEMARLGVTRVAVQSLHVVAGGEYAEVLAAVGRARRGGNFAAVTVGGPLLPGAQAGNAVQREALSQAARALLASLPPGRAPDDAVAVMGHGARGPARETYDAFAAELSRLDPLVFFATLDRDRAEAVRPDSNLGRLRRAVAASGAGRVWLMPFFSVAGAHARRDLAGGEAHSWGGALAADGMTCLPLLAGLLELPRFEGIFLGRLDAALAGLGGDGAAPSP